MQSSEILIIGTGSFATGIATTLANKNKSVYLYGIDNFEINDINNNHLNTRYFKNLKLPLNIFATNDLNKALKKAKYVFLAIPSKTLISFLKKLNIYLNKKITIINLIKGFNPSSKTLDELFCSNIIPKYIDLNKINLILSLYGPSIAQDLVKQQKFSVTLSTDFKNEKDLKFQELQKIKNLFDLNQISINFSKDVIVNDFCACFKNIYAIACGFFVSDNKCASSLASFQASCYFELSKIVENFNGSTKTMLEPGLLGDFILCTSLNSKSRNFNLGLNWKTNNIQNKKFLEFEGLHSLKLIKNLGIINNNTPILKNLYNKVFFEDNTKIT